MQRYYRPHGNQINHYLVHSNLSIFLPITSYLSEPGFGVGMPVIKSKYCADVSVEQEMRLLLFSLMPGFKKLCNAECGQNS